MKTKQVVSTVGLVMLVAHVAAVIVDEERYLGNLARWRAYPTRANLLRLLVAEGILIKDLSWFL